MRRCFTLFSALALFSVFAVFGSAARAAGASSGEAAEVYMVSASASAPTVDITLAVHQSIQLLTVSVEKGSGGARAVLTGADGTILQVRSVDESADLDLQPLPSGTYRLAVLDRAGTLLAQQTFVKR